MKRRPIMELRCAQMALGLLEARLTAAELRKLSGKKLKKALKDHPISVVVSPNGAPYIVDGHHHAYAFWLAGVKDVHVKVVKDYSASHISYEGFWHIMRRQRWTHLYDQFGAGPHDPIYLPEDVRGLGDDPYRSLAWLVQSAGGFKKTKVKFADFEWANFFRRRKLLHSHFEKNFDSAKVKAVSLAKSPAGRGLPGYVGVTTKKKARRTAAKRSRK